MTYHRSVKASEGATITLFRLTLDTTSVTPWIAAIVLLGGGFLLLRRTRPIVLAAWHDAVLAAQATGKSQ